MEERLAHTNAALPASSGEVGARPLHTLQEIAGFVREAPPATSDEVTVLKDGRRLDTPEKVIAWVHEQAARRAGEQAPGDSST